MKTRCNRCCFESLEHIPGSTCGKTDAWNEHPCNGSMIAVNPVTLDSAMRSAIQNLEHYQRLLGMNGHNIFSVQRDIDNLRYHLERT